MIQDEIPNLESMLSNAIRHVLRADAGISIESEGTVYVRSLEGNTFCAGLIGEDGYIRYEKEYGIDVDGAIDWFLRKRTELRHGGS